MQVYKSDYEVLITNIFIHNHKYFIHNHNS